MNQKQFKLFNRIFSILVLVVAAVTYLLTIEPTVSFWDCGEFIASSYKLEIGHPPGNPVFQLIARFFTLFTSATNAAVAVNAMSALCSAFTIFFLYLTIVHLGRRMVEKGSSKELSTGSAIAIFAAGVVGSLAYCWSDTFWFSAVEAEVYAMSSLFTAVVFWAMLKWEEDATTEYANRWIVLIAFLMGLSVGVHLLNLLTIPALAFIYYYKTATTFSTKKGIGVFLLSVVILAVILFGIIPYLPKIAAVFDLLFVNVFGLPFNSGAVFFVLLLLGTMFWSIYYTRKKEKVLANTIMLCLTMIIVGYSTFAMVVVRSSANPPTNEYQPDNPYTLVRYLGREQYGSKPLLYGETFASVPTDYSTPTYWTPLGDKYFKAIGPLDVKFPSQSQMFFPRMWSRDQSHINFYQAYTNGRGKHVEGGEYKMPTFKDNLAYFFDYQVNWMYIRYFMWNFVGRQNDLHAQTPGDPISGNWESGIGFIDKLHLGDQSVGPDYIVNSNAKNHYFFLPLLLGIIGFAFQLGKDKRNWWITFLLFFLTGLAIVVYLNQPPYQVRERDYAYAGSFYVFTIWIGLAVIAIYDRVKTMCSKISLPEWSSAAAVGVITLAVPVLMAFQNWDDHDRSGRYTARDLAYNYLQSTDKNAILVTHGDNDTFPLWYIQEVEGIRTDVRIMNTSLLGTDWYIDQMKCKINDSDPIPFSIQRQDYLYGTNEYPDIIDRVGRPITVKEAIELFKDPRVKVKKYGQMLDYLPARQLRLPVNKENVLKYGIVAPEDADKIVDTLILDLPESKKSLIKTELLMLDLLANYNWDRPIYLVSQGGDLDIGLKSYLQFDGYAYKLVPIKSRTTTTESGQVNSEQMYNKVMNVYRWESLCADNIHIDYQNLYTFNGVMSVRSIFVQTARSLYKDGKIEKAVEVLDKMQSVLIPEQFPTNTNILYSVNEIMVIEAIELYLRCNEIEKAVTLATQFSSETISAIELFATPFRSGYLSKSNVETNLSLYYYMLETLQNGGATDAARVLEELINSVVAPKIS